MKEPLVLYLKFTYFWPKSSFIFCCYFRWNNSKIPTGRFYYILSVSFVNISFNIFQWLFLWFYHCNRTAIKTHGLSSNEYRHLIAYNYGRLGFIDQVTRKNWSGITKSAKNTIFRAELYHLVRSTSIKIFI